VHSRLCGQDGKKGLAAKTEFQIAKNGRETKTARNRESRNRVVIRTILNIIDLSRE
jgi:hypothetical protein